MEMLSRQLCRLAELLSKYGHDGQERLVREILESLSAPNPDLERLTGVDMWGGSGAVWETILSPLSSRNEELRRDEKDFHNAIVQIARALDDLGIGTKRSRSIADAFLKLKSEGIFPWDS
jgi:hypothetical protein